MVTIRTKSCLADAIASPTNYKKRRLHPTLMKLLILSRILASGPALTPNHYQIQTHQCLAPGRALDQELAAVVEIVVQAQIKCRNRKARPQV